MSAWLRKILFRPVVWASDKYSSAPDRGRVFSALTCLHKALLSGEKKKGPVIPFNPSTDRFIIFSDQHKGARDGADDFLLCEPNYLAALSYYRKNDFFYIALGDCEELWENSLTAVKKNQQPSFLKEKDFLANNRGIKIFGNHDLYWQNDPLAYLQLKDIYGCSIPIYEGVLLQSTGNQALQIFCTHGHQGDAASDGNWFSKFFVSKVWAPLQSVLRINPNTPAYDTQLKTVHNGMMYDWSAAQEGLLLITGHTHQPVFESLTHIESLYRQLLAAQAAKDQEKIAALEKEIQVRKFEYMNVAPSYGQLKPGYFNSGCCCFNDGDITGIEISEGCIRLIKWHSKDGEPERMILEEASLESLAIRVSNAQPDA
jgi:UDP-2,3-diacylglucosamine pyrophosphatase LpxH